MIDGIIIFKSEITFYPLKRENDIKVSALGYVWFFLFEHTCFFYEQLLSVFLLHMNLFVSSTWCHLKGG